MIPNGSSSSLQTARYVLGTIADASQSSPRPPAALLRRSELGMVSSPFLRSDIRANTQESLGSVLAIADAQVVMLHQMKDGQDKSYRLKGTQVRICNLPSLISTDLALRFSGVVSCNTRTTPATYSTQTRFITASNHTRSRRTVSSMQQNLIHPQSHPLQFPATQISSCQRLPIRRQSRSSIKC
jgi:hypothetical protein